MTNVQTRKPTTRRTTAVLLAGAKCGDCVFWDAQGSETGLCRFNAPRKFSAHITQGEWARTAPTDWCGQWEPRP
jgi:hypothetical protein